MNWRLFYLGFTLSSALIALAVKLVGDAIIRDLERNL